MNYYPDNDIIFESQEFNVSSMFILIIIMQCLGILPYEDLSIHGSNVYTLMKKIIQK